MGDAYDLYKRDSKGDLIWIETVIGLDGLKKRLMKLSAIKPGKYEVYDATEAKFVEPFKNSA